MQNGYTNTMSLTTSTNPLQRHAAGHPPQLYAVDPKAFGRKPGIEWKVVDDPVELDRLVAAKIQHKYALRIIRRAKEVGITIKEWSARADANSERNNRGVLRGEKSMSLGFIAQADRILGDIL